MFRTNLIAVLFIASDLLFFGFILLQMLIRQDVADFVGERRGFKDFDFARRVAEAHRLQFPSSKKRLAAKMLLWIGSALFLACAALWLSRLFAR